MAATPTTADVEASSARLVAERAYLDLRDRIVTLRLAPGTVLREDALMREMKIGRTPLREAVKRLALENLVAVQPRRGTSVTAVEASDIVSISEVRAELESYAAEVAALRMNGNAREAAEGLLQEIDEVTHPHDQEWLMRFDERIHRFTWEATGNRYLVDTLERYFTHSLRIWYLVLDHVPGLGHSVHDQMHLLNALLERDGERARTIMRAHVLEFQREILAAFSALAGARSGAPQLPAAHEPDGLGQVAQTPPTLSLEVCREREQHLRRVRASPSATCGRWAGSPSPSATAASGVQAGITSPRTMQSSRHSSAVSTIRRGMRVPSAASGARRKARSTHAACATGVRPRSAAASGASASAASGAAARSAARSPWISIEDGAGAALGWTSPLRAAPASASIFDGHASEGHDFVAFEVEPGRLDVHDEEARAPPGSPGGSPRAEAARHPDAALDTRDRAKGLLQRGARDGREARGDQVVGRPPRTQLLDLMLHAQLGHQLERIAEDRDIVRVERPGGLGGTQRSPSTRPPPPPRAPPSARATRSAAGLPA